MKINLDRVLGKPLSKLMNISVLLAVSFSLITIFFPSPPWPIWHRMAITVMLASPSIVGIPVAEAYFRAREGTLKTFFSYVFSSWRKMIAFAVAFGIWALALKVSLPISILIGIACAICIPLHGAMSGSYFSRIIELNSKR